MVSMILNGFKKLAFLSIIFSSVLIASEVHGQSLSKDQIMGEWTGAGKSVKVHFDVN